LSLNAPDWLTARPIAHRGLHDVRQGRVENTLEAAEAAIARGYAIECDVQLSRDGEAIVFHDERLERITQAKGLVADRDAAALAALPFRVGGSHIPLFKEFLGRIAARTPIICEIKSAFDGDMRLADCVAGLAAHYAGPVAFKSFDPAPIARLRNVVPQSAEGAPCPLGIVAMARYDALLWPRLSDDQRRDCLAFLHYERTRPDFLSFCVDDLPHPTPALLRAIVRAPVMAWTVRTPAQQALAKAYADQVVFED